MVFSFGVGLLDIGEGPAFVGIDSGSGRYIFSLEGMVSPGIPCGIAGRCCVVFEVAGRIPGTIRVVETSPLDSILDLISVVSQVEDFLHFPLLLFLDDNGRWWWLVMSRDRFCTGCGFEEADMENWVDFDSGRQVQLIGA